MFEASMYSLLIGLCAIVASFCGHFDELSALAPVSQANDLASSLVSQENSLAIRVRDKYDGLLDTYSRLVREGKAPQFGKMAQQLQAYLRTLSFDDVHYARALELLSSILLKQGKNQELVAYFKKLSFESLKNDYLARKAYYYLAQAYLNLRQLKLAEDTLMTLVKAGFDDGFMGGVYHRLAELKWSDISEKMVPQKQKKKGKGSSALVVTKDAAITKIALQMLDHYKQSIMINLRQGDCSGAINTLLRMQKLFEKLDFDEEVRARCKVVAADIERFIAGWTTADENVSSEKIKSF